MSLKDVFLKAADTAFKVFDSVTHNSSYVRISESSWADVPPTETLYPAKLILAEFSQKDIYSLPFSALIQPTDMKGLIRGSELPRPLKTSDLVRVPASDQFPEAREFHVVAWSVDPADALYVILLREV